MTLSAPEPLADHHIIDAFSSGEISLDHWLKRRARPNQATHASRTYVLCDESRVIGYYALASGAVAARVNPGRFRRNKPDPVPVAILARLAIDEAWQGRGIGRALFNDAARRVLQAADTIGIRGILVHAISDDVKKFYVALGFDPCPGEPATLVVTLTDIRAAIR